MNLIVEICIILKPGQCICMLSLREGDSTTNLAQISCVISNRSDYLRHFRVWTSYFFAKECYGLLSFVLFSV